MINPAFVQFDDNMFHQLRQLLADIPAAEGLPVMNMTIGEPQQPAPELLAATVARHDNRWNSYPKPMADESMQADLLAYIEQRFGRKAKEMITPDAHLVAVPGTREPLHFLGLCVAGSKADGCALVSNPYYHAWRAGAMASGGEIIYMNLTEQTGYLPDLEAVDAADLNRCMIMYICAPSNPHGALADAAWLRQAAKLARQHDFLLVVDECYIDIWRDEQPVGMLRALADDLADNLAGDLPQDPEQDPLRNIVILNSLSKRSNAAGLRAGFLAGDKRVIAAYIKLISNGGALLPTPLLRAAGALYRDQAHQDRIRAHYDKAFSAAQSILGVAPPKGGFFLWLKVRDDIAFTKILWQEAAIRVMPGRYMAAQTKAGNPGAGYVRLALVHDHDIIEQALHRIAPLYAAECADTDIAGDRHVG